MEYHTHSHGVFEKLEKGTRVKVSLQCVWRENHHTQLLHCINPSCAWKANHKPQLQ